MKPDKYYLDLEERGYYDTIDKRSKDYREYKEWKATKVDEGYEKLKTNIEKRSKGLGDTVAKITKATGIDKVVEFISGDDCGCDDRKEKWNKEFPYKVVKCLKEDDYKFLSAFLGSNASRVTYDEKCRLFDIYNYIFGTNLSKNTQCTPCVAKIVKNLRRYIKAYQ